MASHGISRSEYASKSQDAVTQERERKKLGEYLALVAETQEKISAEEYDPRALDSTSSLLKLNPEYYTIWNYRRQILLRDQLLPFAVPQPPPDAAATTESLRAAHESRLALRLKEELEFLVPLLTAFPKCYWIWNYRLWTLQQASRLLERGKAEAFWRKELGMVGMMLTRDVRNLHGWMYRRLVVGNLERGEEGHGSMVEEEFAYTSRMVRGVGGMANYSAWHQRGVLFPRLLRERDCKEQERMDFLEDELELLRRTIATDPEDQSLWFYYRWLVGSNTAVKDEGAIAPGMKRGIRIAILEDQIEWLRELLEGHPECKYVLKALVQYVGLLQTLQKEPEGEKGDEREEEEEEEEEEKEGEDEQGENEAMGKWLDKLEEIDPMRKGRYRDLRKRIGSTQ